MDISTGRDKRRPPASSGSNSSNVSAESNGSFLAISFQASLLLERNLKARVGFFLESFLNSSPFFGVFILFSMNPHYFFIYTRETKKLRQIFFMPINYKIKSLFSMHRLS